MWLSTRACVLRTTMQLKCVVDSCSQLFLFCDIIRVAYQRTQCSYSTGLSTSWQTTVSAVHCRNARIVRSSTRWTRSNTSDDSSRGPGAQGQFTLRGECRVQEGFVACYSIVTTAVINVGIRKTLVVWRRWNWDSEEKPWDCYTVYTSSAVSFIPLRHLLDSAVHQSHVESLGDLMAFYIVPLMSPFDDSFSGVFGADLCQIIKLSMRHIDPWVWSSRDFWKFWVASKILDGNFLCQLANCSLPEVETRPC